MASSSSSGVVAPASSRATTTKAAATRGRPKLYARRFQPRELRVFLGLFGEEVPEDDRDLGAAFEAALAARLGADRVLTPKLYRKLATADSVLSLQSGDGRSGFEDPGLSTTLSRAHGSVPGPCPALRALASDDDLRREGRVRDLVRKIQNLRKEVGLDVADRIHLTYTATDGLAADIESHASYISTETLALELERAESLADPAHAIELGAETLQITIEKI